MPKSTPNAGSLPTTETPDASRELQQNRNYLSKANRDLDAERAKNREQKAQIDAMAQRLDALETAGRNSVEDRDQLAGEEILNQLDPRLMVEIAIPRERVASPEILQMQLSYQSHIHHYPPTIDAVGNAHYYVPREYAERLLANRGGMQMVLVSPKELTIRARNPQGGRDVLEIKASERIASLHR